ncbi:hypothetical protein [Desulforegula conservatrix]|uniref:hypothetical protein n=1 Tax=Desulforegula conservatrix TaxID=153026 RepID=UPI000428346D|nr:hypothetical protein [Desulforegula conservatrix]
MDTEEKDCITTIKSSGNGNDILYISEISFTDHKDVEIDSETIQHRLLNKKDDTYETSTKRKIIELSESISTADQKKISNNDNINLLTPSFCSNFYKSVKQWEGVVIEVCDNSFWARLKDLDSGYEEEVELPIIELSDDDERQLVSEGSFFTWSIGYRITRGTRENLSVIKFRRLPVWSKAHHRLTGEFANEINTYFNNDNSIVNEIHSAS